MQLNVSKHFTMFLQMKKGYGNMNNLICSQKLQRML